MKLTWQEVYDFVLARDNRFRGMDIDELQDEYQNNRKAFLEWIISYSEDPFEDFPGWLFGLWGVYSTKLQEFDEIGFFLNPKEAIEWQEADLCDAKCTKKQLIPFEYLSDIDEIENLVRAQ